MFDVDKALVVTPVDTSLPLSILSASPFRLQRLEEDMPTLKGHNFDGSSHLSKDLGLDSLEQTELLMAVEEEFSVQLPDAVLDKITSVKDIVSVIATDPSAK